MGVVNITPDSFSDGGSFLAPEAAVARCMQCLDDGADLLDLGAESTRPGSRAGGTEGSADAPAVSAEEEQARLLPVLEGILKETARCNRLGRHIQGRDGARCDGGRSRNHQRRERLHVGS